MQKRAAHRHAGPDATITSRRRDRGARLIYEQMAAQPPEVPPGVKQTCPEGQSVSAVHAWRQWTVRPGLPSAPEIAIHTVPAGQPWGPPRQPGAPLGMPMQRSPSVVDAQTQVNAALQNGLCGGGMRAGSQVCAQAPWAQVPEQQSALFLQVPPCAAQIASHLQVLGLNA